MNESEQDRLKVLLREAIEPIAGEPNRDLWPDLLRRLNEKPVAPPWYDWALAGGLAVFVLAFPGMIPVFLYYL